MGESHTGESCRRVMAWVMMLAATGVAGSVHADVLTWDGGGADQFFGTADNWNPNQAPTSADDVIFAATGVAPAQTPLWDAADSVNSITVDNSGGYVWQFPRNGSGNPRTITLGSGGLSIGGGGLTGWGAVTTIAAVDQTWDVGAGTTLSFTTGATIAGSGKITKSGSGTVILPNASNTNTGGYDIIGGVLANPRSTNGAGAAGSAINVYNTGVYEARNNVLAGGNITLHNGGTLRGTGSAGISTNNSSVSIEDAANISVILDTASASDVFTISPAIIGGNSSTVINISGPGTVVIANGADSATAFNGTWKVNSGVLRALAINSLGNRGGVSSLTNVSNPSSVELAGGDLWLAGTTSGSTPVNFNSPILVSADSTLTMDKNGAGTAATGNSTVARGLGAITIGGQTLNVTTSSNITGVSNASYAARFGAPSLNLTGNATLNVIKPSGFDLELQVQTVTESSAGLGFTKSGSGWMSVLGASTYTGPTVIEGGQLRAGISTALGSGGITVKSGATLLLQATGAPVWTLKNDLGGSGTIKVEGGSTTIATLQGVAITPGSSPGILTINGKIALALNGAEKSSLYIDVTGTADTAGTDYDQLLISPLTAQTNTLTGLANADLFIDLSGIIGDISGKTLTIVSAAGTDFSLLSPAQQFASITFSPSWSGTVNYLNGSITLTNLVAVPEPAALSLLCVGGLTLLRRRRA